MKTWTQFVATSVLIAGLALTGCSADQNTELSSTEESTTAIAEAGEQVAEVVETAEETETAGDAVAASDSAAEANVEPFQLRRDDLAISETITETGNETHAITADGSDASYANIEVIKTGSADGDEADFYGTNAAIYATNGATLDLTDIVVSSSDTHVNAVFSYGEGTTINISNSLIETSGNTSGGIMVTGGGTLNATNLYIHTTGNSSAAIRSDRGGGTENVSGGTYITDGVGSPVIYSTADVTVSDATLVSTSSQGIVVEGKNSVSLIDTDLTASNTSKNSDKSDVYQAVMIYQSMSGDAAEGEANFSAEGGSITNLNGDIFFVNNTVASINLTGVTITNEDTDGNFLRAAAAGWGSEGSNGGHVTLNASDQDIDGDILVDEVSSLNFYLSDGSSFIGAINPSDEQGEVYVELTGGSTWTLTKDSYISSLSCDAGAINLNGHVLYVDGVAYKENTASTGAAIVVEISSTGQGDPGGGTPPEAHLSGNGGSGQGGTPPEPPSHN